MQVVFNPSYGQRKTGTCCQLSYHNPNFKRAMYEFFGVKPTERIERLEITEDGIKAIFEYNCKKT
jgi:hypothetical protein